MKETLSILSPTAPLREIPTKMTITELTSQLTASLRKPGRKTLSLIDRALSWLRPFESPKAAVSSVSEKRELLALLNCHRQVLIPYLDIDRIESNLKRPN